MPLIFNSIQSMLDIYKQVDLWWGWQESLNHICTLRYQFPGGSGSKSVCFPWVLKFGVFFSHHSSIFFLDRSLRVGTMVDYGSNEEHMSNCDICPWELPSYSLVMKIANFYRTLTMCQTLCFTHSFSHNFITSKVDTITSISQMQTLRCRRVKSHSY